MKITLKTHIQTEVIKEYDVEFPVYREDDWSNDSGTHYRYSRIEPHDGAYRRITVSEQRAYCAKACEYEITIETGYQLTAGDLGDRTPYLDAFDSNAKKFNEALSSALIAAGLPVPQSLDT